MNTFTLITLVLGIVEPILAQNGTIPAEYQGLATGIMNAIEQLKAELTGANGQLNINAITLMQAIASGVEALSVSGALPGKVGGISAALSSAAAAGVQAYEASSGKVDPATLAPIAPVE